MRSAPAAIIRALSFGQALPRRHQPQPRQAEIRHGARGGADILAELRLDQNDDRAGRRGPFLRVVGSGSGHRSCLSARAARIITTKRRQRKRTLCRAQSSQPWPARNVARFLRRGANAIATPPARWAAPSRPRTVPAAFPSIPRCKGPLCHGENQSGQSGRRNGRRRDDPDHLAIHQGQADPSLPRCRPDVFRSRHPEARRNARPDHHRRGGSHQEGRRRGEMRHHHAGRSAGEGIQPARNVSLAERHHPQHPRRRDFPRADHLQERAAAGAGLDQADHHRPPCLWRPIPRHRFQGARQGQAVI